MTKGRGCMVNPLPRDFISTGSQYGDLGPGGGRRKCMFRIESFPAFYVRLNGKACHSSRRQRTYFYRAQFLGQIIKDVYEKLYQSARER